MKGTKDNNLTKNSANSKSQTFSGKNKKSGRAKKFWLIFLYSLITAIIVSGIAVGIYFLLKPTKDDNPPEKVLPPEIEDYFTDINQGNIVSPDIKNEEILLPSDALITDVVFVNNSYMIVKDNLGSETISSVGNSPIL